jgi:hypothetical protein
VRIEENVCLYIWGRMLRAVKMTVILEGVCVNKKKQTNEV